LKRLKFFKKAATDWSPLYPNVKERCFNNNKGDFTIVATGKPTNFCLGSPKCSFSTLMRDLTKERAFRVLQAEGSA